MRFQKEGATVCVETFFEYLVINHFNSRGMRSLEAFLQNTFSIFHSKSNNVRI